MNDKTKHKKTIALTGATGFVGAHILDRALGEGHSVKAITRRPQEDRKGLKWVSGDLHNKTALEEIVEDAEVLIHCAGAIKARRKEDFHDINTNPVETLLDILGQRKGPGQDCHVIFVSTLTARHPHLSPYARSKYNAEELLKAKSSAHPWTIIRPPAVYGPGDMEILKLFRAMKRGYAPVAGRVDNTFSLIHGRDLSAAVLSVCHHEGAYGATIEPDDKKKGGYTVHDVAGVVSAEMERNVRPLAVPYGLLNMLALANEGVSYLAGKAPIFSRHKVREMAYPDWVADPETHKAVSHWAPEIGLEEGVRETVKWYRDNNHL